MTRVLHVLRQLNRGGIECWLQRLLRAWPTGAHPQWHFALEEEDFGELAHDLATLGAKLHYCPPPRRFAGSAAGFLSILSDYGPFDAVHCHNHHASAFHLALAAQMGVARRISHSHADFRRATLGASALRQAYVASSRSALGVFANIRVAVSRAAAADLFGDCASDVSIVPCGVDLQPYLETIPQRDGERFTLIHVGRLSPEKNHRHLFRLTEALLKSDSSVRLRLVGDGPLRKDLEAEVSGLGLDRQVEFLGSRDDVPALLAAADVFVFPSHCEGLGLAAIEAQAAGLPVVMAAHLPAELDIFPKLCRRLALEMPIEAWANAVLEMRDAERPAGADRAEKLGRSAYSIQSNICSLNKIYAGAIN